MKKIIIFVIALFVFTGCFKEYDEINKYLILDGEQEKVDLVNGIYSRLVRVHNQDYFRMCCRSDDINIYNNYSFSSKSNPQFNWPKYGNTGCGHGSSGGVLSSTVIGDIYVNLYAAIISANNLIVQLSVPENREILGEVYFLRAYCYFKLARFFGRPPLVTDSEVNFLLEKPTIEEVYQLIEEDLLIAEDLLPSYIESRIPGETPHKGTAKAMLAEVYLTMAGYPLNDVSKYAEAARVAKEVIDNAAIYNYELIPDIANLILKSNEHCNEYIFTLFNKLEINSSNGTLSNLTVMYSHFDNFMFLLNVYTPQFKFYKDFPHNYRKSVFLKTGNYLSSGASMPDSTIDVLRFDLNDPLQNPCDYIDEVAYLKYIKLGDFEETEDIIEQAVGEHINIYLLRYAQTLLTYAEAKARSGDLDQLAYEAVNMIRRRANKLAINTPSEFDLPSNLTTEQFIDSVVWERAWEHCFEPDGRWFDLVRLDMLAHLSELRYSFDIPSIVDGKLITKEWYFYQIPQEDRWLNPNLNE